MAISQDGTTGSSRAARARVLARHAAEIEAETAFAAGAIGFMARDLVLTTMPHSRPSATRVERRNGRHVMSMVAMYEDVGLPYGAVPRMILLWMTTEAVRTGNRELVLGDSLSRWMRRLGYTPTGGRWGSIRRIREQMQRLLATAVATGYDGSDAWTHEGFRIADSTKLWWSPREPSGTQWQSTVTLDTNFYRSIIKHPVPVDIRALQALHNSPMTIDIYSWLTYRMSYLRRNTIIPWASLEAQFGADYKHTRQFRAAFVERLKQVSAIYPQARVSADQYGLTLSPSRSHVPPRRSRECAWQRAEFSTHNR